MKFLLRCDLGPISNLDGGAIRLVAFKGPPPKRSILVLRSLSDGGIRAFWNVCKHLPIPLDGGSGVLPPGAELVCATHGATYRREDGYCTGGPCEGASLESIPLELDPMGDRIYGKIIVDFEET